jgi:hypothetical protein
MRLKLAVVLEIALGMSVVLVYADDRSQPYIDHLLKTMDSDNPPGQYSGNLKNGTPFIDSVNSKLNKEDTDQKESSYIEELRMTDPNPEKNKEHENYSGNIKSNLEPKDQTGAIQAYHEGRSELEFMRPGNIHNAIGFRYSVSGPARAIEEGNSAVSAGSFNNVYSAGIYAPEFSVFYEFQPFHSEWFGNFGLVASIGVNYFYGVGKFGLQLTKPGGVGLFSSQSLTQFQFLYIPVMVGVNYRFNLLRILRPYVMVAPTLIGMFESRNDNGPFHYGRAQGVTASLGVSILLDWWSRSTSWDLYEDYSVKHFYLTLDGTWLEPIDGRYISIRSKGFTAGMTYEF